MDSSTISKLQYNHRRNQWWNGRIAIVTGQIKNMHNCVLHRGDRVIIKKKNSCQNSAGVIHRDSFLVESEKGGDLYSIPREMLSLQTEEQEKL